MFAPVGLVSGLPFVLHFHGGDLIEDDRRAYWHMLHVYAARRAARCLVSTPDLLQYAERLPVSLEFLPNPVDLNVESGGGGGGIVFSSKLDSRKGSEIFLPAAIELRKRGYEVTVLGFGSSAYKDGVLVLIDELNQIGAKIIRQRLSSNEFNDILGKADVVVGQFAVGALGVTELDALARGRPIVTRFDFPAAYGAPPPVSWAQDSAGIVEKVESLLGGAALRERQGLEGREWVRREHSRSRIVDRLLTIYEEAMGTQVPVINTQLVGANGSADV
jgi:glycosyltransferase involved in cell wall biosynthesis